MKALLLVASLLTTQSAAAQIFGNGLPDPTTTGPQIDAPAPGQEASKPFKKANVIVLHTTDSSAVAYTKLARALLADGYSIDKSDKELGFINTAPKPTAYNRNVMESLRFVIKAGKTGAVVEERGTAATGALGSFAADCRGAVGSPIARAWAEMCRVAALYSGATISYKQAL